MCFHRSRNMSELLRLFGLSLKKNFPVLNGLTYKVFELLITKRAEPPQVRAQGKLLPCWGGEHSLSIISHGTMRTDHGKCGRQQRQHVPGPEPGEGTVNSFLCSMHCCVCSKMGSQAGPTHLSR